MQSKLINNNNNTNELNNYKLFLLRTYSTKQKISTNNFKLK